MKKLLALEEIALTAAGLYFLSQHNLHWSFWIWLPLFFASDISFVAYAAGPRVGAWCYNLLHHRAFALALVAAGWWMGSEPLLAIGALLFAHASFDRILGYGLKHESSFNDTHLGKIGKERLRETSIA